MIKIVGKRTRTSPLSVVLLCSSYGSLRHDRILIRRWRNGLQKCTRPLFRLLLSRQRSQDRLVEDILHTFLRQQIDQFRSNVNHPRLTCVKALHSTYFTAFNSRASFCPCSIDIGFSLSFCSFSRVFESSRRSI